MTYQIAFKNAYLASRSSAAKYRRELNDAVRNGEKSVLDFSTVESISDSFADELFGVFALQHGVEKLVEYALITNANEDVYRTIALNIHRRLSPTEKSAA